MRMKHASLSRATSLTVAPMASARADAGLSGQMTGDGPIEGHRRDRKYFLLKHSCVFFELSFHSDPRRALGVRAALATPTYIRPGSTRSKIPHAHCEGAGSKGDGTFQASSIPVVRPLRLPALLIPWSCATLPLWNGLGAKPT